MIHIYEIDNDGRGECWEVSEEGIALINFPDFDTAITHAMEIARTYKKQITISTKEWYYDQVEKGLL